MTPPIRVIMQSGTVHTYRDKSVLAVLALHPGWARIERMDVRQPPPLIEVDNDG
jgi:hypothetical protein